MSMIRTQTDENSLTRLVHMGSFSVIVWFILIGSSIANSDGRNIPIWIKKNGQNVKALVDNATINKIHQQCLISEPPSEPTAEFIGENKVHCINKKDNVKSKKSFFSNIFNPITGSTNTSSEIIGVTQGDFKIVCNPYTAGCL